MSAWHIRPGENFGKLVISISKRLEQFARYQNLLLGSIDMNRRETENTKSKRLRVMKEGQFFAIIREKRPRIVLTISKLHRHIASILDIDISHHSVGYMQSVRGREAIGTAVNVAARIIGVAVTGSGLGVGKLEGVGLTGVALGSGVSMTQAASTAARIMM